jgi:hypothetical protein
MSSPAAVIQIVGSPSMIPLMGPHSWVGRIESSRIRPPGAQETVAREHRVPFLHGETLIGALTRPPTSYPAKTLIAALWG